MKIKNWAKHQHFKDRKPPWIKLYRDILDDIEWSELDGDDAKTLVMLWLIASENSGELPDVKTLAFRLRKSTKDVEKQLSRLSKWLISERYQDDINVSQINSNCVLKRYSILILSKITKNACIFVWYLCIFFILLKI